MALSRRSFPPSRLRSFWRTVLWCATVLASAPAASAAGPPDPSIDQMHHTVWTLKDGAPADVWAISQTPDGWLWLGSPDGLFRFDGVTFERIETEPAGSERSRAVSALLALPTGELAIGYRNGGVAILRDGKVTSFHEKDGFDGGTVFDLSLDLDRRLWVATRSGLHRLDGGRWKTLGPVDGIAAGGASALLTDLDGRVWMATATQAFTLDRGAAAFVERHDMGHVIQFMQSPDGRSWYLTDDELRLCPVQPARGRAELAPGTMSLTTMFDRLGAVWSMGEGEISRFSPRLVRDRMAAYRQPVPGTPGFSHLYVGGTKTELEDRDGNIWFSNIAGEVHQIHREPLTAVSIAKEVLAAGSIVATSDAAVWLPVMGNYATRTKGDGLWRIDGRPRRIQPGEIASATGILQSRDGSLWVAAEGWLWRQHRGRFARDIPLPLTDRMRPALAMTDYGTDDALWISVLGDGLYQRRGGAWLRNGGVASLPATGATALTADDRNTLWIGYTDGHLRSLRMTSAQPGIQVWDSHVGAIHAISIGRETLVAGDRGLSILRDGVLRLLRPSEPGSLEGLSGMAQGSGGDVWLNGRAGLIQIRASDLQAAADVPPTRDIRVRVRVFDATDGYPGNGATKVPFGGSLAQSADGRLWFAGTQNPGTLDPSTLRAAPSISPLFLRSVTTPAGRVPASGTLPLAAGTHDLQVDYTALNYAHPDREHFRYRLVGLDEAWTEAGTRRQAFFTNLGPGRYRFEVQSRNDTNDWTPSTATMTIDIPPTFIQSRPFGVICVMLAFVACGTLVQWRVRHASNEAQQKEHEGMMVRMGERERIAREIHDTLLQSVQGVALMISAASSLLRKGQPAADLLDLAASSTEQAVADARERVYELRHDAEARIDVLSELRSIGTRLAEYPGAARFGLTGTLRSLQGAMAYEVLSIGREALLNAYRHARAAQVTVQLRQVGRDAILRIRDDGIGILAERHVPGVATGHWGLRGMQERARRLGGSLTVTSPPEGGTLVELRFNTESVVFT